MIRIVQCFLIFFVFTLPVYSNEIKDIKNVRMRGNRKSLNFTSVTFSEYNKITGNMLNKNGKIINFLLTVIIINPKLSQIKVL